MFFEPLQDADVRQSQRTASLQRNADGGSTRRLNARQRDADWLWGKYFWFLRHCDGYVEQSNDKEDCGSFQAHCGTPGEEPLFKLTPAGTAPQIADARERNTTAKCRRRWIDGVRRQSGCYAE
jgi:hypothetical protein